MQAGRTARTSGTASGFLLVVLGAAMWGGDALFRLGLALELPAGAVVFAEHGILVLLTLPLLVRGLRRAASTFTPADWGAAVLIGAGASAGATVLFTASFAYGDPTTPLLLQKLQPLFAVAGARLLLGERLLKHYAGWFLAAVAGAWLISFPDPTDVGIAALMPAILAVSAAALWGMGTVLGRRLVAKVSFTELTAIRFGIGLPAAALFVAVQGDMGSLAAVGGSDLLALLLLALIPGLAALLLYYRGLRATPASAATLGELAFPLSSVLINYLAFGATLVVSQWLGLLLLAGTITAMGIASDRGPQALGIRLPRYGRRSESALGELSS